MLPCFLKKFVLEWEMYVWQLFKMEKWTITSTCIEVLEKVFFFQIRIDMLVALFLTGK